MGASVSFEKDLHEAWENIQQSIRHQMVSRAYRGANELRNASQLILRGQRHGRVYRLPGTHGRRPSKATKELMKEYGHSLRGGQLYRASAPGEPPAVRFGTFRASWQPKVYVDHTNGYVVASQIESTQRTDNGKYLLGEILEYGSPGGKIAPRPHHDKIKQKALPAIMRIYNEPYV